MRYRVFILVASVLYLVQGVAAAQETEAEKWYFASKPETGEIITYTADGEANTILAGIDQAYRVWRLDAQTAVGIFLVHKAMTFYKLTPDSAQPLELDFNFDDLPDPSPYAYPMMRFVDHSGSYMVLMAESQPRQSGLLLDTEANTIDLLDGQIADVRFSRDGHFLRYITGADYDANTWDLREMNLASGEKRTIYSIKDSRLYGLTPDLYGERWLWYTAEDEDATYAHHILHIDGSLEPLGEPLPEGYLDQRHFIGNDLMVADWYCKTNCSIRFYAPNEVTPVTFDLPPTMSNSGMVTFDILRRLDRDRLLVVGNPHYDWLLRSNGTSELLGVSGKLAGRWLLVWDDYENPHKYRVWDTVEEKFVVTQESTHFNQVYIADMGHETFMVIEASSPSASDVLSITLYPVNGKQIELPIDGYGGYFEMLADGSLLYQKDKFPKVLATEKKPGIYRYDLEHKLWVLLVRDGENIHLEDIEAKH